MEHEQRPEVLRQVATLLLQENDRLVREVRRLRAEIARLRGETPGGAQQELEFLKELLERREQALFGRSSEKRPVVTPEAPATPPARPPQRGHGPTPQPRLPHIETRVELPEAERGGPACGGQLEPMTGQSEDTEEITVVERQYVLRTIQRQKYRCRCNGAVVTAPAPEKPRLVPGGRYSTELATHVAIGKYAVTCRSSATCSASGATLCLLTPNSTLSTHNNRQTATPSHARALPLPRPPRLRREPGGLALLS